MAPIFNQKKKYHIYEPIWINQIGHESIRAIEKYDLVKKDFCIKIKE